MVHWTRIVAPEGKMVLLVDGCGLGDPDEDWATMFVDETEEEDLANLAEGKPEDEGEYTGTKKYGRFAFLCEFPCVHSCELRDAIEV